MSLYQISEWFSPNIVYEGYGRAEFSHPKGRIGGPARVSLDETGKSSVRLVIEDFEPEKTSLSGLLGFFNGDNPCVSFEISTAQGTFTAIDNIDYDYHLLSGESLLTFHLLRSQFESKEAGTAKYWVLPLTNFLSNFHRHDRTLDRHPLRIRRGPVVPEGLSEEQASTAWLLAEWQDRLIIFGSDEHPSFIEPFLDYEERASSLLGGKDRHRMTAVVVGELGDSVTDPYEDHFPLNVLRVLSFASGMEVGSPWMEFRDSEGSLVSRLHISYGRFDFLEGRAVIDESLHFGIGRMLDGFLALGKDQRHRIRPAMDKVTQSGLHNRTIEDRLRSLFQGLDGLCESYGGKKQNLQEHLSHANRAHVKQALKKAARDIRAVAKLAAASEDYEQSRVLTQIADRTTSNPPNIDRDFGLAVTDLLKFFGFPDANIVDLYYEQNPRADGRKWHQMLSFYRGIVTHEGPLKFPAGGSEIKDVLCLFVHLHDLLVRIVLKTISYEGTYNPWVTKPLEKKAVDWVTLDTDAATLGYGKR